MIEFKDNVLEPLASNTLVLGSDTTFRSPCNEKGMSQEKWCLKINTVYGILFWGSSTGKYMHVEQM